ncbi:MAG: sugar isomerase domain-containing protein [Candidatus Njordarchaeia archaeon]
MEEYIDNAISFLNKIKTEEKKNILEAAKLVKESLKKNKPIFIYGTGHSQILAIEIFYRAGGLVPVNAMLDIGSSIHTGAIKSTGVERLPGYAKVLLDYFDVGKDDVIIIISNSGKNAVPVEMAEGARARGAKVIALTGVEYSKSVPAAAPSGKKLFEVADVVIDNKVPAGDAVLRLEGLDTPIAPISTIVNSAILHSITTEAIKMLLDEGIKPPVWKSSNVPGGDAFNKENIKKYKYRIKAL